MTDAGWAAATVGQKQHWFVEGGASACSRFEQAPATRLHPDEGVKRPFYCARCDAHVEETIRGVESPRDLARRALAEHAIIAEATRLMKETDARLSEILGAGGRLTFGEKDGDLGMVYTTNPKGTWKVTDRAAFTRWVAKDRPAFLVQTVDPMFEKAVLAEGHTSDGEIPDGIEFVVGNPALTVKPGPGAAAVARQLVGPIMPEVER